MPELCDRQELFGRKSLSRREARSVRQAMLVRLSHVGVTLRHLDGEEAKLCGDFHAPETTIEQRCAIERVLDLIRDRRRIVLGIPLPGGRRRTIDLPPEAPVEAELLPVSATGGNGR